MAKEEIRQIVADAIQYLPALMWSILAGIVRVMYFAAEETVGKRKVITSVVVSVWCGMVTFQYIKDSTDSNMVGVYVSLAALCGEWFISWLSENYKDIFNNIKDILLKRNGNKDS